MSTLFSIIGIIIALTIHEFSHALVADQLGDPTPRSQGRLTLNPLAHLHPIGTLMLLIARFGWGKPVIIDPYNLKNPKRDQLLIAIAGPGSNILLAIALGLISRLFPPITLFLLPIIIINLSLAIFNLIPIPPLDGSKILLSLLPTDTATNWENELSQYGPILLIILLFLPVDGSSLIYLIIWPIINFFLSILLPSFI